MTVKCIVILFITMDGVKRMTNGCVMMIRDFLSLLGKILQLIHLPQDQKLRLLSNWMSLVRKKLKRNQGETIARYHPVY